MRGSQIMIIEIYFFCWLSVGIYTIQHAAEPDPTHFVLDMGANGRALGAGGLPGKHHMDIAPPALLAPF